jgi:glycosyltransferase involved in cell wall biosynthesis
LEARAERTADYVIGLSQSVTENRKLYFGLCDEKVEVLPGALDEFWFDSRTPNAHVRRRFCPANALLVLHVARIAWYKNQTAVVRAIARVSGVERVHLVFVGPTQSSAYSDELRNLVLRSGLESVVSFAGALSLDDLIDLYDLADVVVLPSFRENCPRVLLEAMARGRPIVASDIPPMREILSGGSGVMVPPTNDGMIAGAIVRLLRDHQESIQMGRRARTRAYERYRWSVVGRQVEKFYERMTREMAARWCR